MTNAPKREKGIGKIFFQMKGQKPSHLKWLVFLFCVLVQKLQNMSHITQEQRYTIQSMLEASYSQEVIASTIGKCKSVLSRVIKRNKDQRSEIYKADLAQNKYEKRQRDKEKYRRFTPEMQQEVETLLKKDYSPEQVVGTLRKQDVEVVSVERIYQHVWEDKKKGGHLHKHLRNQGRRYRKRGNLKDNRGVILNRVDIDQRPKIVEKRSRFGDLEVDLIIGKHHNQAIVTLNDRATGMLKMRKVESKKAEVVSKAIVEELEDWMPYIHTITADNGKEFAAHQYVAEQLNIDHYFAKPYHSWQRGSNENLNGLIRQYFKKSSDFTKLDVQHIKAVESKLNKRPRKRFGFENPIFEMNKLLFNTQVAFTT